MQQQRWIESRGSVQGTGHSAQKGLKGKRGKDATITISTMTYLSKCLYYSVTYLSMISITYTRTHAHTYARARARTHTHTHTHTHARTHAHTHTQMNKTKNKQTKQTNKQKTRQDEEKK